MSREPEHLKDEGSHHQVVLAGATAGLVSRFCIAPLDVIKIRLQLQSYSLADPLDRTSSLQRPRYHGTFDTVRTIVRDEGLRSLWKGNIPAELLYITYGAAHFSTYRTTTQFLQAVDPRNIIPDALQTFIAGASAGCVATTVTYPLDLLRTRFAAQGTERVYAGLIASIRDITRQEGYGGFFKGLGAGVAQVMPYMGLFFASFEMLKTTFEEWDLPLGSGDAAAGMVASVASKTAVFPLDTIRKRLQVQGPTRQRYAHRNIPVYNGIVGTLRAIVRREGARGLYRGLPVSLIKAAPASAITMWTYERALHAFQGLEGEKHKF